MLNNQMAFFFLTNTTPPVLSLVRMQSNVMLVEFQRWCCMELAHHVKGSVLQEKNVVWHLGLSYVKFSSSLVQSYSLTILSGSSSSRTHGIHRVVARRCSPRGAVGMPMAAIENASSLSIHGEPASKLLTWVSCTPEPRVVCLWNLPVLWFSSSIHHGVS